MKPTEAISALNDNDLSSIYRNHYARLESLFAGHPLDTPFGLNGVSVTTTDPDVDPAKWFAESLETLAGRIPEAKDDLIFRPMSSCFNPRGVHFVDDIFGAEVFLHGFSEQWQVRLLDNPVGSLKRPDVDDNASWRKVKEIVALFLEYDPPNVVFELPTLSSALNAAVNLYGEEILVAMLNDTEAALHDLEIVNDVIKELHTWFIDNIPAHRFQLIAASGRFQPFGYGQICGCTTQLPSGEMYEDFIAPLDADLFSLYPKGGLIHLCGSHLQHLRTWEKMEVLRAVQLNDRAAMDLDRYFSGLREDQILYVNFFDDMPLEEALHITGGKRTVFVGAFEDTERVLLDRRAG